MLRGALAFIQLSQPAIPDVSILVKTTGSPFSPEFQLSIPTRTAWPFGPWQIRGAPGTLQSSATKKILKLRNNLLNNDVRAADITHC